MHKTSGIAGAQAAKVSDLDERLDSAAGQCRAQEAALAAALDTVATPKRAMKAASKDRDKLRAASKIARRAAVADMLQRRRTPISTHPEHPSTTNPAPGPAVRVTSARPQLRPARSGAKQYPPQPYHDTLPSGDHQSAPGHEPPGRFR